MRRNCEVCGSNVFTQSDDGFFYCNNCNSQAEDVFDTGVDEEDLFTHYSRNNVRSSAPINQPADDDAMKEDFDDEGNVDPNDFGTYEKELTDDDYYREVRSRYVTGLQIMIQMQCKVLVEDFKVSPLIVGLVGPIWLRYVASSPIMVDEWADSAIRESETQTRSETQMQAVEFTPRPSYRSEPVNNRGKRSVYIWCKSLRSSIPISTSLAISFLVCHVARESVLPADILKWILEGKLPYFAAFREIEKQIGSKTNLCPISASRMFRPIFAVSSQKLESMAAGIARRIGLELPPVNFYAIASRFCNQLSIPTKEILPLACRVCQWSMPSELYLPDNEFRIPTRACVMSVIIVAVRILFNINGYGIWESNLPHSGFPSSCDNENDRVRKGDDASSPDNSDPLCSGSNGSPSKLSVVELFRILETKYNELDDGPAYSSDLETYLKYCKDVVFSGLWRSSENLQEEILIAELWDFYQKNSGTTKADNDPTPSYQNGESSPCTSHSQQDDDTQPSKDQAIRRLKLDMEENKFCYIPPRVKVKRKDYLHYARKRKDVYVYAVHADYYILLRSCAKVAQVEPRVLHIAVLTFERRLQWLENKMASSFDFELNLADDVCDICKNESVCNVEGGDRMEEL